MNIYVRKIFPHDVTHEVSVRKDIVYSFFEGNCQNLQFIGKKSKSEGIVTINSATDPRFGGYFKRLLLDEGRANINDILLITKLEEKYDTDLEEVIATERYEFIEKVQKNSVNKKEIPESMSDKLTISFSSRLI